jgi:hypothetical protein
MNGGGGRHSGCSITHGEVQGFMVCEATTQAADVAEMTNAAVKTQKEVSTNEGRSATRCDLMPGCREGRRVVGSISPLKSSSPSPRRFHRKRHPLEQQRSRGKSSRPPSSIKQHPCAASCCMPPLSGVRHSVETVVSWRTAEKKSRLSEVKEGKRTRGKGERGGEQTAGKAEHRSNSMTCFTLTVVPQQ